MRTLPVFLALLLATPAAAAPLQISHQGRLLDSGGDPLDGAHDIDVALYEGITGGSPVWEDSFSPDLDSGYFHLVLGSGEALDSDLFDGDELYVGLTVDGTEMPDRLPLTSVPWALRAGTATSVSGGVVDASEVQIDGVTVIDSSGSVTLDALGDVLENPLDALGCIDGQVAISNGIGWECADVDAHTHSASDIVDGTLAIEQLPVGTTGDDVAKGDHTHSAADVGAIAAGGPVPVGDDPGACDEAGTLRYGASGLQLCDGDDWRSVTLTGTLGHADSNPGESCHDILESGSSIGDGLYWIDPSGSKAYQAYCDMTTAGGGWTLVNTKVTTSFVTWSNFFKEDCAKTLDGDCKSAVDTNLAWKTAMWRFADSRDQVVLWRADAHSGFRDFLRGAQTQANPNIGGWSKINQGIPTSESTVSSMHYYYDRGISENHGGGDKWIDTWNGADSSNNYYVRGNASLAGTKCLAGYCSAEPLWFMVR